MPRTALNGYRRYVLLDANLVAGYYLPASLGLVSARPRIKNIIDAVKNGWVPEVFLYIPELCIPEVFAVFAKYYLATWDKHVIRSLPKRLKKSEYNGLFDQFQDDLHNNRLLNQVELSPYHILATHLINCVDANYQYYRHRNRSKKMMGATDHTIIGMGISLSKIHGRDNFAILTADHRLADILTRATSMRPNTAKKLGLLETAEKLGLKYSKDIYPRVLNLAKVTKAELKGFFGRWPLPTRPIINKPLMKFSEGDAQALVRLREKSGIGRDSLPYTDAFESICREFERIKGQIVDRHAAWMAIGRIEKKGKKETKS